MYAPHQMLTMGQREADRALRRYAESEGLSPAELRSAARERTCGERAARHRKERGHRLRLTLRRPVRL